jgi:hypothetical protein
MGDQGKIGLLVATALQDLDFTPARGSLVDVVVQVVVGDFQFLRAALQVAHLSEREAPEGEYLPLEIEHLLCQVAPSTAAQVGPERQGIEEETHNALAIRVLRPPVRD